MINRSRNNQIRERMMNHILRQMQSGASQGLHQVHQQQYVRQPAQETIDIDYEDVTDVKEITDSGK